MADAALGAPVNGTIEIAGPEPWPLDKLARSLLNANGDRREVIADVHARYYGTELNDQSLTPGDYPRLGSIRFEDWPQPLTGVEMNPAGRQPKSVLFAHEREEPRR